MPTITGNAATIERALQALDKALLARLTTAEKENIADVKGELVAASKGDISTAQLTEMGHPFARRAPQPSVDPSIINDQGGPFADDWRETSPAADTANDETVIRSECANVDPVAKFMNGTKHMIKRPIIDRVKAQVGTRVAARRREAVRAAVLTSISS